MDALWHNSQAQGGAAMVLDGLLAGLVLLLIGSLPSWPYSRNWGYYGTSGIATLLVVVVALMLLNVL